MSKRLFTKLATHSGHEVVVLRFHVFVCANEAWDYECTDAGLSANCFVLRLLQ